MRPLGSAFALFCSVTTIVVTSSTANAGFNFGATFNSVDPAFGSYNYTARGGTHTSAGGRMNWTSTSTLHDAFAGLNGRTGNNFITFCIEVTANISGSQTYNIETKQLKDLPTSGSPSPMDAAKANDIAQFWGRWESTIASLQTTGNTNIAGFGAVTFDQLGTAIQLAIWEIVYEQDGTGYNVNTEGALNQGFRVNSGDATTRSLANHLLTYQMDFTSANTNLANVIGLKVTQGGNNRQDQVTIIDDEYYVDGNGDPQPVPVPPAIVLALTGIAGGIFLRRRLAGQTKVAA